MKKPKEQANKKEKVTLKEAILFLVIVLPEIMIPSFLGGKLVPILFFTWPTIYFLTKLFKLDWDRVLKAAYDGIRTTMTTFIILASVGLMVASLIMSDALSTIVDYGLKIMNPQFFLLSTILINFVMSAAMGSAFGAAFSSGVAMMSIGMSMQINPGMTAAAIMCGVVFGERCSPMSEESNTVAAICEIDILTHIRSMMNTMAIPFIITCIIFEILGFGQDASHFTPQLVQNITAALESSLRISWITLLPLVVMVLALLFKAGSVLSMMFGTITGVLVAIFYQHLNFIQVINCLYTGYSAHTSSKVVDHLLSQGGVVAMGSAFFLLLFAIGMGSMMNELGVTHVIIEVIKKHLNNRIKLILSTMFFGYLGAAITCASSPGAIIVGNLFKPLYDERRIPRKILARTLEDTGTIGSLLIPWNVFPATFMGLFAVTYSQYIPFVFLSFLVPVMSILYAITGWTIHEGTKPQNFKNNYERKFEL